MTFASLPRVDDIALALATPRKLPKPDGLGEQVVVLDVAFVAEGGGQSFEKTTGRFIERLGPRLVAWVDHHDSRHHARFAGDGRFVMATKAEHGACPEMITPELVGRFSPPDTIICHLDFDGLASAAKWIRRGQEPYPGCDDDARAIDTCLGAPGPIGARVDRALRARQRDDALRVDVVRFLVAGAPSGPLADVVIRAAAEYGPIEQRTRRLAERFVGLGAGLVLVDATDVPAGYDKTLLLLLGQERGRMAAVVDGDTVTFAAPFDSGVDFVQSFGLSGGMPTRVSIRRSRLAEALRSLDASPDPIARLLPPDGRS